MTDVTHNDFPVYQHLAREDRYIIYNGELIISYYSIMNNHITLANSWFITHEISNSGPREFISDITAEEKGHIADGLDWQYNTYPNCQTVRSEYCCQKILVSLMFHWLQWTIKTLERISRRCFHSGWSGSQLCLPIHRRLGWTQRVQETGRGWERLGDWRARGHRLQGNYMLFWTCA